MALLGNRPPLIPKREARPVIYLLQLISAQSQAVWPYLFADFKAGVKRKIDVEQNQVRGKRHYL